MILGLSKEIVVALIAAVPLLCGAYLTWRHTQKMDAAAKQSAASARQVELARMSGRVDTTEAQTLWDVLTKELERRDKAIERLEGTIDRQEAQIWDLLGGARAMARELGQKADVKAVDALEQKIDKANGEPGG